MVLNDNEIQKLKDELKSRLSLLKHKRNIIRESQNNLPNNKSQMALRRTFANLNGRNKRKEIQEVYNSYTKELQVIKKYNKNLDTLNNKLKLNKSKPNNINTTNDYSTKQQTNYSIPKLVLNSNKFRNKMENNIFTFFNRTKRKMNR